MVKKRGRALTRTIRQTGSSNMKRDLKRKAIAPGKRRSKTGKIYYEYRKNRSDVKGRDTPVKSKKRKAFRKLPKPKNANQLIMTAFHNAMFKTAKSKKLKSKSILKNCKGCGRKRKMFLHGYCKSCVTKARAKVRIPKRKNTGVSRTKVKFTTRNTREPLRGVRRHDLLPLSVRKKLPRLYSQEGKKNPTVYLKLFSPYSQYTFYVTEFDGKNTFFGYVSNGRGSEWGYSSFKELVTANRGGLPLIERDKSFSPIKASLIKDIKLIRRKK